MSMMAFSVLARDMTEADYVNAWCTADRGETEKVLFLNGRYVARVDCSTPDYAIEFDFAHKWAECGYQALFYGALENKLPACMLIIEVASECRFIENLQTITRHWHIPLRIMLTGPAAGECD